jgi:hypothetical protein
VTTVQPHEDNDDHDALVRPPPAGRQHSKAATILWHIAIQLVTSTTSDVRGWRGSQSGSRSTARSGPQYLGATLAAGAIQHGVLKTVSGVARRALGQQCRLDATICTDSFSGLSLRPEEALQYPR